MYIKWECSLINHSCRLENVEKEKNVQNVRVHMHMKNGLGTGINNVMGTGINNIVGINNVVGIGISNIVLVSIRINNVESML